MCGRFLGKFCQNRLKYDHLKTEALQYKLLHFSPGPKRLEPDSKYSTSCLVDHDLFWLQVIKLGDLIGV